jgi:hypothetical protein
MATVRIFWVMWHKFNVERHFTVKSSSQKRNRNDDDDDGGGGGGGNKICTWLKVVKILT